MKKLFLIINNDKFFLSHRKPIALAAKEAGYDVTIVASSTGLESQITELGIKYINLPMNTTGMNPKEEFKTYKFLKKLYKKEKPDIIHQVGLKPILWGTIAARQCGIKNVVNAVSGTGFLFSPAKRNSIVSKGICKVLSLYSSKKNYKYIFQNTDDEKEFFNTGIIKHEQVTFIKGSGVDLNDFKYVPESEKDNFKIKCVFTGRMVEDKGVLVIFEAAKILKEKYSEKIEFWLCGDLDTNPKALKKEQIESECDGTYVKWLGFQKNIKDILSQCHIMIFPSFYMEGLPKSVIDAEAVGLPLITTDWVGCRDTVIDGENGFLIPIKDANSLAEKIGVLVDDSDLRQRMGKSAREYAEKYFSIENVVNKHLEIYNELINRG
ncbi:glycosyltransferase family 4 protein [Treponema bryantii]|uniref:glycosyltransferase family 4 protein n=1 Tax=Treponema bryantii TaxID=163 RepID=UPI002B304F89|nr:glycosyl transferase family 1 [Treponema bryantii]